ncbi:MAG: heme-binding protein [Xanthomonadales bacterium]|nr:heme-binding protein [Xanthomonadales bacterium]MDH4018575.1 heme-binding protein [Xanthomonadales bacterium]
MKSICASLIALLTILTSGNLMATEEAEYSVSLKEDQFEIREYAPSIVAEVIVYADFEDASNDAFRSLFKYISGDNTRRDKIEMTSPVSQKAEPEKIAMTSPVAQRASGKGWAVSFMMPASYTMETIPVPENPSVSLREIPAYRAAAIRYSGGWSEKSYKKHLASLREWIKQNNLTVAGEPVWARYNAPFTPWFMRRNEILIALAP